MISLYFGSPGAGKTTLACKLMRKKKRKYKQFYSNFENTLSTKIVSNCLGNVTPKPKSLVVIDEAGIDFNNRDFKSFPKHCISWFKLHRHYKCDVIVLSQSWDDTDITIRRLATELWYIKRIGFWTLARKVYKYCGVDENTHQIVDGYRLATKFSIITSLLSCIPFFGIVFRRQWSLTFRPFYYRFFDTYDAPSLPEI